MGTSGRRTPAGARLNSRALTALKATFSVAKIELEKRHKISRGFCKKMTHNQDQSADFSRRMINSTSPTDSSAG